MPDLAAASLAVTADTAGASQSGLTSDPLWDDWDTALRTPATPVLHLDGFDGPLDLLLELAERHRLDLGRVSPRALAEQFVAELEGRLRAVPIERRADWHVVAARLMLLRSRLLLPASPTAAAAAEYDTTAELRRLGERGVMRAAAAWLDARPVLGRDVFARPGKPDPRTESYMALMEACLTALRGREGRPEEAPVYRPVVQDLWRVADAMARVRAVLAEHPDGGELAVFVPAIPAGDPDRPLKARAAVASTLLAGLELARGGEAALDQPAAFGQIFLSAAVPAAAVSAELAK